MNERNINLRFLSEDNIRVRVLTASINDLRVIAFGMSSPVPDVMCPLCHVDLNHIEDQYEDRKHYDLYSCPHCGADITYITPEGYHAYNDAIIQGALIIELDFTQATVNL